MKKIIPFVVVIIIALAAFFGLQHFTGNRTTAETVKEEISLPDLAETTEVMAQEEVSEPTTEPTVTPEPTTEPTATPAPVVPTADPNLMYIMRDPESGKIYYQTEGSEELLLQRIHENISAEEAVDAVECVNYGAMMVVSHDDERIIDGISAYDLISDETTLKVTFNRNGSQLYVCGEEGIKPSEKSDKTFKGLADRKAYGAWICSEHQAFKGSALLHEGYPESSGYRGPFAVADGFSAKVLKSVVLVKTGEDRYEWCLVSCDCKDAVKQPSGGGGSKPTKPSKPTQAPTQAPTQNPTQEPAHAPEATLPPKPTQEPAHAPEVTLPPKPTEPVVTSAPELGNPSHAQEDKLPEKKSETTSESESAHANEQKAPEKKTETSSEVKSSESALPPKKGTVSASSNEPAPALGGVTF